MFLPYLHFQGDCRAAVDFYCSVLGGHVEAMTYGDLPGDAPTGPDAERIVHAALITEDHGTLFASDYPPGEDGAPQQSVDVVVRFADVEAARSVHDALSEGGESIQAFGPTFYSPGYGMFRDRFGTHWIVLTDAPT